MGDFIKTLSQLFGRYFFYIFPFIRIFIFPMNICTYIPDRYNISNWKFGEVAFNVTLFTYSFLWAVLEYVTFLRRASVGYIHDRIFNSTIYSNKIMLSKQQDDSIPHESKQPKMIFECSAGARNLAT